MFEDTRLDSLADVLHEGLFVVGPHRHIVLWNRAARRLTGFRADEIVGRQCYDGLLVHVDGHGHPLCDRDCPLARCVSEGKPQQTTAFVRHRDGHRLPVHIRTSPVRRSDGHVLGIAQMFEDAWDRPGRFERYMELRRMAMVDQITRIANRRYLLKELAARGDAFRRYGWRHGVLLLGLDGDCERIDPTGEARLERVLGMVAQTLDTCVRSGDVVGRWGRREFLVVTEHADVAELSDLGERLRALVAASFAATPTGPLAATVSVGGAVARPGDESEILLRRAAGCLRSARGGGGDQVIIDLGQSHGPEVLELDGDAPVTSDTAGAA